MVIGSGMLARALGHFNDRNDILIFASGVSNSTGSDPAMFQREQELLKKHIQPGRLLVYFSTTSLFDPSLSSASYILHKRKMEELVSSTQSPYLIIRLPQVVGPSQNPNTLVNFLYASIRSGSPFSVHAKACRQLISLEDVKEVVNILCGDDSLKNTTINVCFDNDQTVLEIVSIMERLMKKKGNYKLEEKGACFKVDNSFIRKDSRFARFFDRPDYTARILQNYIAAQ